MRKVIFGHAGMVGSAIHRLLPDAWITDSQFTKYVDLRLDRNAQLLLELAKQAEVLYLCAARVGGIQKNIEEPGTMIYDNLMIQANVIEAARLAGVKLIVFLGSSCIYPTEVFDHVAGPEYTDRDGPWKEEDLMHGPLEPTNEAYAVAKISGIKMLEAYHKQYGMEYIAVMPCNLYGPGDNFDPKTSHFLPAMIRKFHEAKITDPLAVTLWGTGTPRRELMHVDDCARIIVGLVAAGARGLINIGPGVDFEISEYAHAVAMATGYEGAIEFDASKPDGVMRKLLNVSRMKTFDLYPGISLPDGIESTYRWFLENRACNER